MLIFKRSQAIYQFSTFPVIYIVIRPPKIKNNKIIPKMIQNFFMYNQPFMDIDTPIVTQQP